MNNSFLQKLTSPVDAASLAFLRIAYGLIMAIDIVRLYIKGNLHVYYLEPTMAFNYYFAAWIGQFSDQILIGLYWAGFILSICFMLGYRFKVTGLAFVLIQAYFFLSNPLNYLNHMYLAIIIGFLLWLTPSHKIWSLDSIRYRKKGVWGKNDSIPKWSIYIMIIQLEIMLIFAGLVKLTPEFLEGHSLREWFNYVYAYEIFSYEWQIRVGVIIAVLTHLLAAPFLLIKKTRVFALMAYGFFHISNATIFSGIGIFPYLTFAATTVFLDPSWPRTFMQSLKTWWQKKLKWPRILTFKTGWIVRTDPENKNYTYKKMGTFLKLFLCFWITLQIFLPLRHYLISDNVHWDRGGNLFSWQMMLISRRFAEDGGFYICGENAENNTVCSKDTFEDSHLPLKTYVQIYMYPDLALQYAAQLKKLYLEEKGYKTARVYGVIRISMSGRPFQNYWDPDIDLTTIKRSFWGDNFILPVKHDRPDIPPLNAKLSGNLTTKYGYWQDIYPKSDLRLYDNFHQKLPREVFDYIKENHTKEGFTL